MTSKARIFSRAACAVALTASSLIAAGFFADPAAAADFPVTSNADSGPNTLRQALTDSATAVGDDTVTVQPGLGTITLASPISWNGNGAVAIDGNGVTIDLAGQPRGLVDNFGSGLTITDFTIRGAGGTTDLDAAPIVGEGGTVSVSDCTITANTVTMDDEGDAAGAVLTEGGGLNVTNCTISNNHVTASGGDGGALVAEGGALVVQSSTITGNTTDAAGDGATVLSEGGALTLAGTTVSGNTVQADSDGGGGLNSEGGAVTLRDSTVTCNTVTAGGDAGGGILSEGGTVTLTNSTVNGNSASSTDGGVSDAGVNASGNEIINNNSTVGSDTSICAAPPPEEPPATPVEVQPSTLTG